MECIVKNIPLNCWGGGGWGGVSGPVTQCVG